MLTCMWRKRVLFYASFSILVWALFTPFFVVYGDTVSELRDKIAERNTAIADLEKEIADYQKQIETTGSEAKTLQSTIRGIDLEQKKLSAEIRLTENKISAVNLRLEELADAIDVKENRIGESRNALAETIRSLADSEKKTLVETMLSGASLSTVWGAVDDLERFQRGVRSDLQKTKKLKAELEDTQTETRVNRIKLVSLRSDLSDKNLLLAQNKKAKSTLLATTKSKEAEYRKILAQKIAKRNAFEQELLKFESELRFVIDPSRIPTSGSGVLKWPLDAVKITQEFGDTAFSKSGAYAGKGHNGVDFRAPNGTPIKASLSGTVKGTGNTDAVCPGASYGKWVLIEHSNGLSTLYAHFSLVKVSEGQSVSTGEVLGYAGETGYATGPHLHFTVYATQGVKVMQRKSAVCGGTYTMPIADLKAYLDPMKYL
ncbi:MAG: peptidoglycan DD-metalloendopeptidase family protein [bacterium]|nr:peptidoglycan DD-metalloendopeptidase family protein [bacterium]